MEELERIKEESLVLKGSTGHILFGPANYPSDRRKISYEMQRDLQEVSLILTGSIGGEIVIRESIFSTYRFIVQNAMQRICDELKLWSPHNL